MAMMETGESMTAISERESLTAATETEFWESPNDAQHHLTAIAEGIALTAGFVAGLLWRAYGPPPARMTMRLARQQEAVSAGANLVALPRR
jgi:hypothetical protein